ncbi:HAMP domain-containing sensor histidine kinase [Roseburia hominis]
MYIVLGILCFIIILQAMALWKYQRQVKDICRQLAFLMKNDSNMLVTGEIKVGGIGKLMDILNTFLAMRRAERKKYLEKERVIADTYTNLSHDIRTPLTSLDGYFQLLETCEDPGEQKRYLGIIQERIQSLKAMLEELFMFTKLKNESYQMELSRCCLNRILKETVFSYYDEWLKWGIEPEIRIADTPFYIEGNDQGLKRLIQNVIKNGLDHGEQQIRIELFGKEEQAVLKISNQTRNPEEIDVSQVFERFYKADPARSRNSTGLGLSIAKELAVRMGGTIRAGLVGKEFYVEIKFPFEMGR